MQDTLLHDQNPLLTGRERDNRFSARITPHNWRGSSGTMRRVSSCESMVAADRLPGSSSKMGVAELRAVALLPRRQ
jgi:hypothetical protein